MRVIHTNHGFEGSGRMTRVAVVIACNVTCVFAERRYTVVATDAVGCDADMIEAGGRFPCGGAVTLNAVCGRCYVCRCFAGRDSAVMAATTNANYLAVIHFSCRFPHSGRMASFAYRSA